MLTGLERRGIDYVRNRFKMETKYQGYLDQTNLKKNTKEKKGFLKE